jgi:DNA primase large subunit
LFRHRFETDDANERSEFLKSLQFDWQQVDDYEKSQHANDLKTCMAWNSKKDAFGSETWFKVGDDLDGADNRFHGILSQISSVAGEST